MRADESFEQLAARLELHTVNLAEHQAQLRDQSLRQIVNEIRANSAFLADSVVALSRAERRRAVGDHLAVRPVAHELRAQAPASRSVVLYQRADLELARELVSQGYRVTVVQPSIDHPWPPEVVVAEVPAASFQPSNPAAMVVWVADAAPDAAQFGVVRRWLGDRGVCLVASRSRELNAPSFEQKERRTYRFEETQPRLLLEPAADSAGDLLYLHIFVAR